MAKKSTTIDLDNDFTEVADSVVMVDDVDTSLKVVDAPILPPKFSPERTEFILSHLTDKELFSGNPKVSGLVRLVEKFIGEIIETGLSYPEVDLEHNACAAIVSMTVETPTGKLLRYSAGADHSRYNNDNPKFVIFPTACASTKAMGRAAIQALGIVCTSSEEMCYNAPLVDVSNEFVEPKISDAQMNAVEIICKSADMNTNQVLWKYAQEFGHSRIGEMTKSEGASVIKAINVYQQGSPVPSNLQGFKPLKKS